jgi:hypothetical protein
MEIAETREGKAAECAALSALRLLKCRRDVWLATDVEQFDGDSQRLPRRFDCLPFRWRYRVSHIVHEAHPRNHGECLFQQLDSLTREFSREST